MNARLLSSAAVSGVFALAAATSATAQEFEPYVAGTIGVGILTDSDNSGAFVGDFTTGEGTTIPAGTVLPDGTSVGWTTEFETGLALSGAFGVRSGPFRGEFEIGYQSNDVDTHTGVAVGGGGIGTEDAGVLITGSPNLNVTVGDLVADGQGDVQTLFYSVNGYYDIQLDSPFTPFVGVGIGAADVDVEYAPSATPIVDDGETVFFYQLMAGGSFAVNENVELFGLYRFRDAGDVSTDVSLFNANLDVEIQSHVFEVGARFAF